MAISGAGLQSIYQRLNSAAEYHPLEADTFADWSLEAGDIVTVTRDGTGYQSPVHSATHVWKGVQTVRIASGGDEKRESVARMSRRKYAGSGSGVRSAGVLGNRITMVYNGLSAEIVQTESEMSTRMTDMYNGLESYVVQTASVWGSALEDAYNGLSSTIVQTASMWSSELQDAYNGLDSKVEQTASHWSSELQDAYNGLDSKVEQTASHWSSELQDAYNGLDSKVEQTASHWSSELQDAYNGLDSKVEQTASMWSSELQDAYNGLDSKVEQTASQWSSELNSAYNGLSSKVEQTASTWNVRLNDTYAGLSSRLTVTDGKVDAEASARKDDVTDIKGRLIVEAGKAGLVAEVTDSREILYLPDRSVFPTVGQADKIYLDVSEETYYEYKNGTYVVTTPGKTIKAGSITTAINEAGESEAHIDAQKVYIGNSKSTTVISGKLDAADVTSDYLNAKLAQIALLNVRSIATNDASGTSSFSSYYGNHYYLHFPGGGGSVYNEDMRDGIKDVQIAGPTNNVYKLQYKKYGDSAWRDADVPFSRAIDSASWEWANGRPTVTLSPQSQSFPGNQITHATPAYDSTLNKWMMEIQAMGSGTPPTYTNIGHTVNLNNYLQDLTGTNKITSNGTYTPSTSGFYIGYGSVEVEVQTGTTLSGAWNSGVLTVTASPQQETYTAQLSAASTTWDGNTGSRVIWDGTAPDAQHGRLTGYTVSVDATVRYNAGVTDGKNAVTINKGSWSGGQISFSKSEGTASNSGVLVSLGGNWSGNSYNYTIYDNWSGSAVSTGYTGTIDATARYNAGVTDGKNAVTINKGSWSSGQISFTKSEGTASTKTVQLTAAAATWSGNTASVKMWDGTAADAQHGSDTGYTVTVDASGRYNAGVTAGKNAVTISKGSWSSGKVTFSKSEGTASNSGVQVSLGGSWSGNSYNYTIYDNWSGSAVSTGYTGSVDASGRYSAGVTDGKNAVTINKGNWSSGQISFTKSEGTASTKTVQLTAAATTWNGNTGSRVIWDGTAADAQHGVSTGYTVTVDASGRYNAGYSAGESAGYSSGYSAGRSAGWLAYYNKWRYPSANASSDSLIVYWPSSTYDSEYNSGPSRTYTLTLDTSNKRVDLDCGGETFARKSVSGVYDAGYSAGESAGYSAGRSAGWLAYYNKWRYPSANTSSDSLTVYWPSSTYDSAYNSGPSRTYTLTLDTSNKRVDLDCGGETFARKSVSDVYDAGWLAYYNEWRYPSASGNTVTVYWPSSTTGSAWNSGPSRVYTLSKSGNFAVLTQSGRDASLNPISPTTVAQLEFPATTLTDLVSTGGSEPSTSVNLGDITSGSSDQWMAIKAGDTVAAKFRLMKAGGGSHSPTIDSVWTSSYIPSGATQLNSLKTQYELAKSDGDFFCVRVDCNGTKKTYYCEP